MFVRESRYDLMMQAFGGEGITARSPDDLERAVRDAIASGRPTLVNAIIDPGAGTESGRIGNLNPQSAVKTEVTSSPGRSKPRQTQAIRHRAWDTKRDVEDEGT